MHIENSLKACCVFSAPAQPINAKYKIDASNITFYWDVIPNSVSVLL